MNRRAKMGHDVDLITESSRFLLSNVQVLLLNAYIPLYSGATVLNVN